MRFVTAIRYNALGYPTPVCMPITRTQALTIVGLQLERIHLFDTLDTMTAFVRSHCHVGESLRVACVQGYGFCIVGKANI